MPAGFELLRSLEKDCPEPVETNVTGTIPDWLSGTLFRNGPGRYEFGDKSYTHLYDGHACVHRFSIADGKVTYSNKLLDTITHTQTKAQNRLFPTFAKADVGSNLFGRLKALFTLDSKMDNVNVSVAPYGNLTTGTVYLIFYFLYLIFRVKFYRNRG